MANVEYLYERYKRRFYPRQTVKEKERDRAYIIGQELGRKVLAKLARRAELLKGSVVSGVDRLSRG